MTDAARRKLLASTIAELELTKEGYDPAGGHWRRALGKLQELDDDLAPPVKPSAKLPELGPVTRGGKSLLTHSLTHQTSGIALFPALDTAWGAGTTVIAAENCVVDTKDTSANPGEALYLKGDSGLRYWLAHIDRDHPLGKRFEKGAFLGKTVATDIGGGPHAHWGINAEKFLGRGKQLKYGRDGNGPDYTFGSPTIGAQLRKTLSGA